MNSQPDAISLGAAVGKWAVIIGSISFVAGFVGPLFLSSSNLGPLLGIFVTGPIGVIAGALYGAVHWAAYSSSSNLTALVRWIALLWITTLLYTLFMVRSAAQAALPGIGAQVLIIVAGAFLLRHRKIGSRLPVVVQKCGPIALVVSTMVVVMTAFPPVMSPWWAAAGAQRSSAAELPSVAFLLHPGFDASQHVPLFAVNVLVLVLEWIAALALGSFTTYIVARRISHAPRA